jgi:hypothetical protein
MTMRQGQPVVVAEGAPTQVSAITREHVERYLAQLFDRSAPATVAKHYRSLQRLFRFLVDDGEITASSDGADSTARSPGAASADPHRRPAPAVARNMQRPDV